ncbi:uncharacterized protein FOMMEDRAFT_165874, partial [Fomitiporia mediterranea MF3/22]|uniref:uncharacterized protein n=1 Tax=Fomitiporia mediterranea (strain MF3/22) TaxID=694068 RepID=UPI0004407CE2
MPMSDGASNNKDIPGIELDPDLYDPSREEIDFLKSQTKIEDEDELKQHVLDVQKEAWSIVNYRCIQSFGFITLKISHLPAYQDLLRLGKQRQGAIFLDFACCFGNDTRKVIADGYPVENVIASDLKKEFWEIGHKLFKSDPGSFPVPCIQGDIFDPNHLAPAPPHYSTPTTP